MRGLLRTELNCIVEMILVQENQKGFTPVITELGHCLFLTGPEEFPAWEALTMFGEGEVLEQPSPVNSYCMLLRCLHEVDARKLPALIDGSVFW